MRTAHVTPLGALLAAMCATTPHAAGLQAGPARGVPAVQVAATAIGGTVVNASGASEAGVWVIAETKLPVPFRKIVVTDDRGRFFLPDLPPASYAVWVRGYGLKDSERVKAERGRQIRVQVVNAATPAEAAKIYPASYWAAMIRPPARDQLPAGYTSQEHWLGRQSSGTRCFASTAA